jgi:hypothetical protein
MTTLALPPTIALVDDTGSIDPDELTTVAGALGEQIALDFEPAWHVRANVIVTKTPGPRQWAVRIQHDLDEPGALGYHVDKNGVPVSYVMLDDGWAVTVSHEVLEMLADPWGNYTHSARVPDGVDHNKIGLKHPATLVHYLVEVCDPCEAITYPVQGVELSDFILPAYYRSAIGGSYHFCHTGKLTLPREVFGGGYVSFARSDGEWFQVFNRNGLLQVSDIGKFSLAEWGSTRAFTDFHARQRQD